MKTKNLLWYSAAFGFVLTLVPLRSQPPETWHRVEVQPSTASRPGSPSQEKEVVTFLGVETAPVSETLSAQLNLPKDSGLVVIHIVPDSPAASALKEHDVLVKLDDQLLVEPRQFSVLVRNHKDGDEVNFSYIRAGKAAAAKVKLAKHEVPKTFTRVYWGEPQPGVADVMRTNPDARAGR